MALELDYMEYANNAAIRAAYPTSEEAQLVLYDYYYATTDGNQVILGETGTDERAAQGFKFLATNDCARTILRLQRVGNPSDNVVVRIETDSAAYPSGTLVNANATKSIAASTISDLAEEDITFVYPAVFSLTGGTQYHIVLCRDGSRDEDNYIRWSVQYEGSYSDGAAATRGSGTWDTYPHGNTPDFWFENYVDMPSLQCYSESSIKQQGSYSLKGIAKQTYSLNETLTRTIGSPINLSGIQTLKFDIRASRTGSNIKIGIHDSGGTTTEKTHSISNANTWETVTWDISGVANANKDAIDKIIVTILNADADNTFYLDNFYAMVAANSLFFGANF